ncbi:hypothetical protein SISNIDRAFT_491168 [Sistotremastrum niveocremeum HHB9708]|uniref:Peptidase C14 caspase domain-containing protein n=1 Tax=Sistotremastrum niveocremeum HHB9708 TaxID=1314777 RepID=A0A164N3F5_9AGAM|nr:hypothetical protein SISNIDRAFT_491168 [Sistotremastrum niveocremeum HHB9708]
MLRPHSLVRRFSSPPRRFGPGRILGLGIAVAAFAGVGIYNLSSCESLQDTVWRLTGSRGTGKHKALIVAIAKVPGLETLDAPHSDAEKVSRFLLKHGWDEACIKKLVDHEQCPLDMQPTEVNILKSLQTLVENARAGDHLFLYVATHGFQRPCTTGDEEDSKDEGIYSCDGSEIIDNILFDVAIKPLPEGCNMTVIILF